MKIKFPYSNVRPLEIGLDVNVVQFALPKSNLTTVGAELVSRALRHPIGNVRLALKARDKKKIVIISDDISRPTPTYEFIGLILDELHLS
jgi:nickel-dependent lactate racemase